MWMNDDGSDQTCAGPRTLDLRVRGSADLARDDFLSGFRRRAARGGSTSGMGIITKLTIS